MFYWFVNITIRILAKILFRLEAIGLENIPKKGSFILASNHCSHLDPPLVSVAIYREIFFLAKAELFKKKIFAIMFKWLNCISVNREGADRPALKTGLRVLSRGAGLLIFPEGTRSANGELGQAKAGVAAFAFSSNAPVIPVFIKGSGEALAPGRSSIKFTKIKVFFGEKLYSPKIIDKSARKPAYQEFTDRIMQEIANLGKK